MKLRAIAIDDDEISRMLVKQHAVANPHVELLAVYSDPITGAAGIILDKPDVLFLDIEMPEFDGIQIMSSLVKPPKIIVISANPNYTDKALALNAIAFIDKPLDQERFDEAVSRVLDVIEA